MSESMTRILRRPEVLRRCGFSNATLKRFIAAGAFPRPIRLGEMMSGWPEAEVEAWLKTRIAARDAGAPRAA